MVGRVLVTGHEDHCMFGEPRQYVWQDGGRMMTGTLADYADSYTSRSYDGSLDDLGSELRTWDAWLSPYAVTVARLGTDVDLDTDRCWISMAISVPGETVLFALDGDS